MTDEVANETLKYLSESEQALLGVLEERFGKAAVTTLQDRPVLGFGARLLRAWDETVLRKKRAADPSDMQTERQAEYGITTRVGFPGLKAVFSLSADEERGLEATTFSFPLESYGSNTAATLRSLLERASHPYFFIPLRERLGFLDMLEKGSAKMFLMHEGGDGLITAYEPPAPEGETGWRLERM